MAYRHNTKTGGLFQLEGTAYYEPDMKLHKVQIQHPKFFKYDLGPSALAEARRDTGDDTYPSETAEGAGFVAISNGDVTWDIWKDERGWHSLSSSQEADEINHRSRRTAIEYVMRIVRPTLPDEEQ